MWSLKMVFYLIIIEHTYMYTKFVYNTQFFLNFPIKLSLKNVSTFLQYSASLIFNLQFSNFLITLSLKIFFNFFLQYITQQSNHYKDYFEFREEKFNIFCILIKFSLKTVTYVHIFYYITNSFLFFEF